MDTITNVVFDVWVTLISWLNFFSFFSFFPWGQAVESSKVASNNPFWYVTMYNSITRKFGIIILVSQILHNFDTEW